jgi:pyruvate,water dikinase
VRLVAPKTRLYAFDDAHGDVRLLDVPAERQRQPSVTDEELADIARLGIQVDERLGHPMDIEWAIGRNGDGRRRLYLLQARPETVWSRKGS